MSQSKPTNALRIFPQTTLRRLRNTPGYFFLIWRWSTWLYALIWIVALHPANTTLQAILLVITFLQSLAVTLYAPLFAVLLPQLPGRNLLRWPGQDRARQRRIKRGKRRSLQQPADGDEEEERENLARSNVARKPYWNIAFYTLDVVICGLVVYFSGYWTYPPFGASSPFYRYGLSTALVAGFSYGYGGGLSAALGYDLFMLLGAFFPPPGAIHFVVLISDLEGSLIDAPIIAILAAYLASLLNSYIRSKRLVQDDGRRQKALRRVGETLVAGASDQEHLLQSSAEQIRKGGHFERLVIALVGKAVDTETETAVIDSRVEAGVVEVVTLDTTDTSESLLEQAAQARKKIVAFEPLPGEMGKEGYGIARLYLPCFSDGQVYLVLGAESIRQAPFEAKQEEFLSIVGPQLVVALENLRLTERAAELATAAERGRIAREIHDGVAQLIYMLSLNTETCLALAQRIAESSEEEKELLLPLTERLDRLVTISKQALWETRHYMFTLKPLIRGSATLTQMVTSQVHEFEAISGLPVDLEIEGVEEVANGDQRRARMMAQVGTAIFRITQEALTNAYKHANATRLQVTLRHLPHSVEVEICDNGRGLHSESSANDGNDSGKLSGELPVVAAGDGQRIYSGHGIRGMRERAEELGGTLELAQAPTGGLRVRACIPM
jgi:signal transduction histidine kinase